MGKHTHRLTEIRARAEKQPGLHNDGDGLNLKVTDNGTKSWILRFKIAQRAYSMGLGAYPAVTLAEARKAATEARAAVRDGINPIEERRARRVRHEPPKVTTFEDAAERYIAAHELSWRNDKHRSQPTPSACAHSSNPTASPGCRIPPGGCSSFHSSGRRTARR
jgi:hypothetical protein